MLHGGRWSAAGAFTANNLSTTQETAQAESSATFTYYKFAPSDVRPKVIVAIRVRFFKVLDMASAKGIGRATWLELDKLIAEDWRKVNSTGHESLSQALGRAAHDVGAEGLIVPSARVRNGMNVVYFPESLTANSQVEIPGESELDRWLKKR